MNLTDRKPGEAKTAIADRRDREGVSARARYDEDFHRLAFEQAALLRASGNADLDIENIAEELETLGRDEFDKMERVLSVLLTHMLKWDYQPRLRGRSWAATIRTQRRHYSKVLNANPSLKPRRDEARSEAYEDARDAAESETGLPPETFSAACPYSWPDILDRPFAIDPDDA